MLLGKAYGFKIFMDMDFMGLRADMTYKCKCMMCHVAIFDPTYTLQDENFHWNLDFANSKIAKFKFRLLILHF